MTFYYSLILLSLINLVSCSSQPKVNPQNFDVVVYGATPAGIMAAISSSRQNLKVILLEQTRHVGGLNTSGLNRDETEHMDVSTFGGLSESFFSSSMLATHGKNRHPRTWESHIAEKVFLKMLEDAKVEVRYEQHLVSVKKDGTNIREITTLNGDIFKGKIFIDCTYEGDLLAKAGVSYTIGREATSTYDETLSGVRYLDEKINISPYDNDGNLLPHIMPGVPPKEGEMSPIPLAFNIRLNLTTDRNNMVDINKPENYDAKEFELLARLIEKGLIKKIGHVLALYWISNSPKKECNNNQFCYFSLSIPGAQTAWVEGDHLKRAAIYKQYRDYTHGILWFLKSDPRVPEEMRRDMQRYGFCKDEWTDNEHWPWYIYIRAGRRMVSDFVMTQKDLVTTTSKADVIHIGSHFVDSHHVARYAVDKDHIINEGRIWQEGKRFDIPYRAIVPPSQQCTNLLVPVCLSASHVAFCAIRVEATWMHLGEVCGLAAAQAITKNIAIQKVDLTELQQAIQKVGIPLK